jgi:F-type H+-transporting ATPase subunit a
MSIIGLILFSKVLSVVHLSIVFCFVFTRNFSGILQAYIFTMLSALSLGSAVEEHHHHEEAHH